MKEFMFEEFENGTDNQQEDPLKFRNESLEIELNRKSQRIQLLSSCFCKSARKPTQKEPFYSPWIKLEESKNAEYKVGILKINKKNRYDAYVRFEDGEDYFIPGMKHMNRALDGDVVICQKLKGYRLEKEMKTILERKQKMSNLIQMRQQKVNISNDDDGVSEFDFEETRTYATVVGVEQLDSRERIYVGTICSSKPGGIQKDSFSDVVWFKPVDVRVPFMLIQKNLIPSEILLDKSELYSCLFTVKIHKWVENSIFPLGKYCGKLGLIGQIHTECEAILCSNGIYWEGFDDIVMNDLLEWNGQSLRNDETIDEFSDNWIIPEEEYAKRLDLRNLRVFSIDPPTARDLDDAVSCKKLDDGKFEIGVHIADVSHFVKPDTNLDKEAQKRATSVYLTHKVIPMLPRLLCENLCSLNENVERLAFSVFWTFDEEGNIIGGPTFHKSIIKSCARLWYDHAQAIIDGKEFSSVSDLQICGWSEEDLKEDIITLYHFSKILRQKRFQNGSLTLNSIKLWFKLDEVGNPIQSGMYQIKDSNRLIEEFMLLANIAVAHKIASAYPDSAMLRRHQPPLEKSLLEAIRKLEKNGITIDTSSSKSINDSLNNISDPTRQLISRLILIKSMKRADYYCSGAVDASTFPHFALSVPLYTHFTSPIRRYCDLIVHRLLEASMKGSETPYEVDQISIIAKICNQRNFAASDAQDQSDDLFLCLYLHSIQSKPEHSDGIHAKGYVMDVGTRSYDVFIPEFGLEKRVWIEDLIDENIRGVQSDTDNLTLKIVWDKGEQIVTMYDHVNVVITTDITKSPPIVKVLAQSPFESLTD